MNKQPLRAVFMKTDRAVYISHLDLMRTLQRAMSRAKLPIWHTEGYNPHIYVSLPLALPLGVESVTELMDFAIIENIPSEQVRESLNAALPEGIKVKRIFLPKRPVSDITEAEYEMTFFGVDGRAVLEKLNAMMRLDKIEFKKRNKKKAEILIDIKPYIHISETVANGCLSIKLTLPTGSFNINTAAFTDAFLRHSGLQFNKIYAIRTKLLCADGTEFV